MSWWRGEEISSPIGNRTPEVQRAASYCTDRAIQVISADIVNINEDVEEHEKKRSWLILILSDPRI